MPFRNRFLKDIPSSFYLNYWPVICARAHKLHIRVLFIVNSWMSYASTISISMLGGTFFKLHLRMLSHISSANYIRVLCSMLGATVRCSAHFLQVTHKILLLLSICKFCKSYQRPLFHVGRHFVMYTFSKRS